jgi:DNA-binding response OmpR family regulator
MKQRVLLIEPDGMLASLYGEALREHGYTVVVAKTAEQGVAAADAHRPDIVVLELQMARHNGVEFLYEFRSYTEWQDIPIIVLTSLPEHDLSKYALLPKPLEITAVLKKSETSTALLAQEVAAALEARRR